jgi:hypothetical protein
MLGGHVRFLTRVALASLLSAPVIAQSSEQWSSCQTITGVSNYLAYANSVLLTLSPGISGCNPVGIAGAVLFTAGVDGVTSDNIGSFLASGYAAYLSGHQVAIFYDNSTVNCAGVIISLGGAAGQCP